MRKLAYLRARFRERVTQGFPQRPPRVQQAGFPATAPTQLGSRAKPLCWTQVSAHVQTSRQRRLPAPGHLPPANAGEPPVFWGPGAVGSVWHAQVVGQLPGFKSWLCLA